MLFRKKCAYCDEKIEKGKQIVGEVKVPEFTGLRERPFCCNEHLCKYVEEVKGTKRTRFCPTCPIGN